MEDFLEKAADRWIEKCNQEREQVTTSNVLVEYTKPDAFGKIYYTSADFNYPENPLRSGIMNTLYGIIIENSAKKLSTTYTSI